VLFVNNGKISNDMCEKEKCIFEPKLIFSIDE